MNRIKCWFGFHSWEYSTTESVIVCSTSVGKKRNFPLTTNYRLCQSCYQKEQRVRIENHVFYQKTDQYTIAEKREILLHNLLK